jgi:succinate dehydrogenase/fumarate reductase flavoprotein subunit
MHAPDLETDVLVIGYGCAGASAAITATDLGAETMIVEKTEDPGGNARYAAGFLFRFDGDSGLDYLDALCFGQTPTSVLEAYLEGLVEIPAWIAGLGGETFDFQPPPPLSYMFPAWPRVPGGSEVRHYMLASETAPPTRRGAVLFDLLAENVTRRPIDVRLGAAATELVLDDGKVVGAVFATAGGPLSVRARGGVVLACGGFEGDQAMKDAFLPMPAPTSVGHLANTGDAVTLAQQAGASLWHMTGHFGWFSYEHPDFAAAFTINVQAPSFILVDADGRRFCDETGYEAHDALRPLTSFLPRRPNRPVLPLFAIFDEQARLAGPLNGIVGTPNDYQWSADNSREVEAGWIAHAAHGESLAAAIGVDPAELTATLAAYEEATARGEDREFGRAASTLVPLGTDGGLYAIRLLPGIAVTTGGPRRDAGARVLDRAGAPIAGLYAAGSAGSVWTFLTEHGGGLTDAMTFGRLAGAGAARSAAGR